MTTTTPPTWALEQAVDWLLRLEAPQADPHTQQEWQRWLNQAPQHQQAWAHLQARLQGSVGGAMQQLQRSSHGAGRAGRQALLAPIPTQAQRRKLLGTGLAALLASVSTAWLVNRLTPLNTLAADLRTGTGERLQQTLADGSLLTLDARSAVNIAFTPQQRLVHLLEGALIAQAAPMGTQGVSRRPFVVQSAEGTVQALGTRFMVRQRDGSTLVRVMEHSVSLTPRFGASLTLQEGEAAMLTAEAATRLDPTQATADWAQGLIDVRNLPLGDVIDTLRPYHAGIIRVSPEAARLRIFGVFSLDQPQQVFQDLVDTQPVRVRQWGHWLTLIDVAS